MIIGGALQLDSGVWLRCSGCRAMVTVAEHRTGHHGAECSRCSRCKGSGRLHDRPEYGEHGRPCPACDGTGRRQEGV